MHRFPQTFKAICHPVRQKILNLISIKKELAVNDLVKELGLAQATISHHVSILKKAKVINVKKSGTQSLCSICCLTLTKCCQDLHKFIGCCKK
ncbi:ArsR family transcriptional regulator [Candidatus Parcubacteria bacterium]|nr:MAG: ArsR family transcriptional regulator [Candidatus Parcubacteria bacterium]